MFSLAITDSDIFLDMPMSTQCLYFHLGMRADDEGFINNPRKIIRMLGSNEDELKILIAKKLVILFETGVSVITHWNVHNKIRKDRVKVTHHLEEKSLLVMKEDQTYELSSTLQPNDNQMTTKCQHSIGKVSLVEASIVEVSKEKKIKTSKSYDDALRLANYLYQHIKKFNPNHKKPNLDTWAKDIDLAIRIDNRTVQELKDCIVWIYSTEEGVFWRPNVLSGKKLRANFDTMNMQSISKKPTKEELKLSEEQKATYSYMLKKGFSEEDILKELGVQAW